MGGLGRGGPASVPVGSVPPPIGSAASSPRWPGGSEATIDGKATIPYPSKPWLMSCGCCVICSNVGLTEIPGKCLFTRGFQPDMATGDSLALTGPSRAMWASREGACPVLSEVGTAVNGAGLMALRHAPTTS
jgi:hypothetical protein